MYLEDKFFSNINWEQFEDSFLLQLLVFVKLWLEMVSPQARISNFQGGYKSYQ